MFQQRWRSLCTLTATSVVLSIEEALEAVANLPGKTHVLVMGCLHLVGGTCFLLAESSNDQSILQLQKPR